MKVLFLDRPFILRVLQPISELLLSFISKLLLVRNHLNSNELCVSLTWDAFPCFNSLCSVFGSPQSKYELVLQRVIRWFIEGSLSHIIFLLVNETTKVPSLRTVTSLQITGNQFRQDYFQSDQNLSTVFLFFLFLTFFFLILNL